MEKSAANTRGLSHRECRRTASNYFVPRPTYESAFWQRFKLLHLLSCCCDIDYRFECSVIHG